MSVAVSLRNISKKFKLYGSPKERFLEVFHPFDKKYHREFWALKNINCEIHSGQTVGIIGRNGSGKSTLLQIIAGVLQPTEGQVDVNGRVAALLELGAGFNPEFTGRENVILNGVITGVSREEMLHRIQLIEEFADIGEFIDQPVKTYSSGMFVRLAFAAAINVDPDILIVDEALSVGDAKFQNKCFQKLHEFMERKKTVLFVTHSMETISRLCNRAFILDSGHMVKMGKPNEVVNLYFNMLFADDEKPRLIKSIKHYNLVSFRGAFYALPQGLGEVDYYKSDLRALPGVICAERLEDVQSAIASFSDEKPRLIKSIKHYNLVSFRGAFYALPQELGEVDYYKSDLCALPGVVCADTIEAMQSALERELRIALDGDFLQARNQFSMKFFFEDVARQDNCRNRKTYNKNESRSGDRRAEILDYLLVCRNEMDFESVNTWDHVTLYMKVIFHDAFKYPVYGYAIKTVEGVKVAGTNTWLDREKTRVSSTAKGDLVIFCYDLKLSLTTGDYFISLAVCERDGVEYVLSDHRSDMIHILVRSEKEGHNGLVEMETEGKIVSIRSTF